MAKIWKGASTAPPRVLDFGRDALEEFPDTPPSTYDLPEEGTVEVEEEVVDPAAIRAAILEEARAEAEAKVKEAFEAGFQRGMEKGREAFEASVSECAAALHRAAEAMQSARHEFLASLEPQVTELATLIAERVLQREVRTDPDLILSTVRRALACIVDRQHLKLRINPADLEALQEHKIALLADFDGEVDMAVEVDEDVAPGDCLVDSELMHVEARMDCLLAEVLAALERPAT